MDFIEEIIKYGGEVYLVGGSVRDRFLKRKHNDIDLLVRLLNIDTLESILTKHGKIKEVGKSFGIIIFKTESHEFDIALPRTEVSTGPGYRDFEIVADKDIPIEVDLGRRDATINAIAMRVFDMKDVISDSLNDHIVDPFNGISDINNKLWRAVNDPYKRFTEDPTRILRVLRQSAQFDLEIEKLTKQAIIDHAGLIGTLLGNSSVRLTEELVRLVSADYCSRWIDFIVNESKIGKIIDMDRSREISKIMERAIKDKLSIEERMFILLHKTIGSSDKIKQWIIKFNLPAAPSFPNSMIKFLNLASLNYSSIFMVNDDSSMRWLIVNMEGKEFTQKLLRAYLVINGLNDESLMNLFEKNKHTIVSINEIKINGIELQEKYHLEGKQIGSMKKMIFEAIIEENLENTCDTIIKFIDLSLKN